MNSSLLESPNSEDSVLFECGNCGIFKVTGTLYSGKFKEKVSALTPEQRESLSNQIESNSRNGSPLTLGTGNIDSIISNLA